MKAKQQNCGIQSTALQSNVYRNLDKYHPDAAIMALFELRRPEGGNASVRPLFEIFFQTDRSRMKCRAVIVNDGSNDEYFLTMEILGPGQFFGQVDGGNYEGLVRSIDHLLTSAARGEVRISHIEHYQKDAFRNVSDDAQAFRKRH